METSNFYSNPDYIKNGAFGFPDDNIPFEEKCDAAWNLAFQKAIYSYEMLGYNLINQTDRIEMVKARRYADGKQDEEQYFGMLFPALNIMDKNKEMVEILRQGKWILPKDIFSIAPALVDKIVAKYHFTDFDMVADAVDEASLGDKNRKKCELLFERFMGEFSEQYHSSVGLARPVPEFVPKNDAEMTLSEMSGDIDLGREVAMTTFLEDVYYISDEQRIKDMKIKDSFVIHQCASMDYACPQTGKAKVKYLDPQYLGLAYTREYEAHLSLYGYYQEWWSIADLKAATGWSDEIMRKIANNFSSQFNNPSWNVNVPDYESTSLTNNMQNPYSTLGSAASFIIPVIFAAYRSNEDDGEYTEEIQYWTKYKRKDGSEKEFQEFSGNRYDDHNRKTVEKKVRKWNPANNGKAREYIFQSRWIPGTEYIFDYGQMANVNYKKVSGGSSEYYVPELPFHFSKMEGLSPIQRIYPLLDAMHINWLKLLNNLSKAAPKGSAIDIAMLKNVVFDKTKPDGSGAAHPLALARLHTKEGLWIYSSIDSKGRPISSQGNIGMMELEGGIGKSLQEFIELDNFYVQKILNFTGLTPESTGVQQDPNMPVTSAKMAMNASSYSTQSVFTNYIRTKQMEAKSLLVRIANIMKYDPELKVEYMSILGAKNVNALTLTDDDWQAYYNIKIRPRMDDQMKADVKQIVIEAEKAGQNGAMNGITVPDLLHILDIMDSSGDIHRAVKYLITAQRRFNDNLEKKSDADSKRQVEQAKAIKADKFEDDKEAMMMDLQAYAAKKKIDFTNKSKEIMLKATLDEMASKRDFKEAQAEKVVDIVIGAHNQAIEQIIGSMSPQPDAKAA